MGSGEWDGGYSLQYCSVWQQIWFGRIYMYVFLTALAAGEGEGVHVANNTQFDTYMPREVAFPSLGPNNPTKTR